MSLIGEMEENDEASVSWLRWRVPIERKERIQNRRRQIVRTGRYGPCAFWRVEDETIRKRNGGCMLQEWYEKLGMINQWSFVAHANENEGSAGCGGSRLW